MELCDSMGFMVMDEIYDEWKNSKNPFGYGQYFDEWYDRDVTHFVHRDRNHPCVMFWSAGNEITEQTTPEGAKILEKLVNVFHREDPSRFVTAACNQMGKANQSGFSEFLDIHGYNYCGDAVVSNSLNGFKCGYDVDHEKYPNWIMFGSENVSALCTRGVYHFPIEINSQDKRDDYHCNAYDWKSDISLIILKTRPYVFGMFTWEGIDYIGEPTPYDWPTRSSQYGIVDLAGFPKDTYFLYKSQWTEEPWYIFVR